MTEKLPFALHAAAAFTFVASLSACGAISTAEPNGGSRPEDSTSAPRPGEQGASPNLIGTFASDVASLVGLGALQIDAERLTHLNHAAAEIVGGACVLSNPLLDLEQKVIDPSLPGGSVAGNINALAHLRAQNPELKLILSIGRHATLEEIGKAASTDAERETIAESCVSLMEKLDYDGIDLDLAGEPTDPSCGCMTEAAHSALALLEKLRVKLDLHGKVNGGAHYVLSTALPAADAVFAAIDISALVSHVDYVQIEAFDFLQSADKTSTCLVAPLHTVTDIASGAMGLACVDDIVDEVKAQGLPMEKLVLGVAFEGRGWIGVPSAQGGLFQSALAEAQGDLGTGQFSYSALLTLVGFESHWNEGAESPWMYNPLTATMIAYEDATSIFKKAQYAKDLGLFGVGIHHLGCDGKAQPLFDKAAAALDR